MDGDAAPLREIVALKEKYGAWLMVDEAHATGIIGENGRGLADELGVSDQIEIQMGTLGKALGASGGYICGSRALIDFLVNRARSFIFTTAPVPAAAAAATAGIQFVQSAEGETRRKQLWQRVGELNPQSANPQFEIPSAIIPLILGDETKAVAAAAKLREQNIFVPAIRYPTVARGAARLRITLTAAHSADDVSTARPARWNKSAIVNRKLKCTRSQNWINNLSGIRSRRCATGCEREPIVIAEGKGAVLRDVQGREYLDANSSIWTNLHGHNHPKINAAIRRQLKKIAHSSALGFANEPASLLAEKLVRAANPARATTSREPTRHEIPRT